MRNLLKILLIILMVSGSQLSVLAQDSSDPSPLAQEEIQKLSFLIGNWKGSGWMIGPDQKQHSFDQEEIIQMKLAGTAILVQGVGTADGKVVHNAMAVISDAEGVGKYDFSSFLQNGRKGTYKAELIDGKLFWYPADQVRYIISINEKGQWFEIGEYKRGDSWFKFFEMTLDKTN
jgi:hypothetical protein